MKKGKAWNEQERYALAQKLDAVQGLLYAVTEFDVSESLIDALDDAIDFISPEYAEACAQELEAGMNSPEAAEFAERFMKSEQGQALLADLEARRTGKIVDIKSGKGKKN